MFYWKAASEAKCVQFFTDSFGVISEAALLSICAGMNDKEISALIQNQRLKKFPVLINSRKVSYYIPCVDDKITSNGVSILNAKMAFMLQDSILSRNPEQFVWHDKKALQAANDAVWSKLSKMDPGIPRLPASAIGAVISGRKPGRVAYFIVSSKRKDIDINRIDEVAALYGATDAVLIRY